MLALSFGLLLVMGTVALLLADMERKRRIIVDLLNQLLPLVARSRRLAMANLRRLSGSPVQAYSLIDPFEREIGLVENEHDITPPGDDARRTSLFAGTRLAILRGVSRSSSMSSPPPRKTPTRHQTPPRTRLCPHNHERRWQSQKAAD